jgi:hypothetical protein
MLHAGPGGIIVDSKVKTNINSLSGNGNGSGANTSSKGTASNGGGSGNTAGNQGFVGFANSFAPAASSDAAVTVPRIPQRPPAVAANGNNEAIETGKPSGDNGSQPGDSVLPTVAEQPVAAVDARGDLSANGTGAAGSSSANAGGNSIVNPSDPQSVLRSLLSNGPNPVVQQQAQQQPNANGSPNGTMTTGGIAGVASIAKGHTIKLVNDQDDFSLWEFYYDMAKEATAAANNALGQGSNPAAGVNPNGTKQNGANQAGFGGNGFFSTNSSSSTSNSSGNSSNPATAAPAQPAISPTIPPSQ